MFTIYFKWWYGENLVRLLRFGGKFFVFIFDFFSVPICLKTLFSVWRRDRIDTTDLSLKEKFSAWSLNFSSRFIGFFIKIVTLAVYLVATLAFIAIFGATILLYFCFPVLILSLLVLGIKFMSEGK